MDEKHAFHEDAALLMRWTLAESGMDEGLVRHMPHGAIRWAAESDKQGGFLFVSPIGEDARAALERYRRKCPRMGSAPLFPAPRAASKSIRRDTVAERS